MLQTLELNIKNRKVNKNGRIGSGTHREDCYLNTSMRVMLLHRQQRVSLPRPVVSFGLLQHMFYWCASFGVKVINLDYENFSSRKVFPPINFESRWGV
jgi:hypothetical protein